MVETPGLQRGDVLLVQLDPTAGSDIRKTRPCLIVSPDELNDALSTLIVAPMTTGGHRYPFRVPCRFQNRNGFIVLDRLHTIDRARAVRRLGRISSRSLEKSLEILHAMFAR